MATITMIDLLGTDNVAVSRTDINTNFQTVENAVNTLETYLDTTPAGGSLAVGSTTINLGANAVTDILFSNQGSSSISGDMTVALSLTVGGVSTLTSATVPNQLLLTGTGVSPQVIIGSAGNNVPVVLRNITLADEELATETATAAVTETAAGTGVFNVDITGKRKLLLDYALSPASPGTATSANIIEFTGTPIDGQRIWIGISDVGNAADITNIYLSAVGFDPKYDQLPTITPYNTTGAIPTVNCAVGFDGTLNTANAYKRQWVEVYYNGSNWEVYNSHKDILGL